MWDEPTMMKGSNADAGPKLDLPDSFRTSLLMVSPPLVTLAAGRIAHDRETQPALVQRFSLLRTDSGPVDRQDLAQKLKAHRKTGLITADEERLVWQCFDRHDPPPISTSPPSRPSGSDENDKRLPSASASSVEEEPDPFRSCPPLTPPHHRSLAAQADLDLLAEAQDMLVQTILSPLLPSSPASASPPTAASGQHGPRPPIASSQPARTPSARSKRVRRSQISSPALVFSSRANQPADGPVAKLPSQDHAVAPKPQKASPARRTVKDLLSRRLASPDTDDPAARSPKQPAQSKSTARPSLGQVGSTGDSSSTLSEFLDAYT